MSAKLSRETRAAVLADLKAREGLTMKAIGRRHGVSRQTLTRLRFEALEGRLSHFDSSQAGGNLPQTNTIDKGNTWFMEKIVTLLERLAAHLDGHDARLRRLEIEQEKDRDMLNELRRERLQQQASEQRDEHTQH